MLRRLGRMVKSYLRFHKLASSWSGREMGAMATSTGEMAYLSEKRRTTTADEGNYLRSQGALRIREEIYKGLVNVRTLNLVLGVFEDCLHILVAYLTIN